MVRGLAGRIGVVGALAGVVAHRFRRQPGPLAEEPEAHVVVVVVAPLDPAAVGVAPRGVAHAGRAVVHHPVEVDVAAEDRGLEADGEIALVERAVQDGRADVGKLRIERQRVDVRGRNRRIVGDEFENVVPHLRQERSAADSGDVTLRGRLGVPVAEAGGGEAEDLQRLLRRPVGEVAERQDEIVGQVGDADRQVELPVAAQQAHVGVVGARVAQREPEGHRHREAVAFVGKSFVPAAVGDGADRELQPLQVRLRQCQPACCARVLALQDERGHAEAGGVDPVVVLQVLVDPPRVGKVGRDLLRLGAELGRDRGPIGSRERLVDPVVRDGAAEQHVRFIEVGAAERGALAIVPRAPAGIREQLRPGDRRVLGIARHLIAEGPDGHLVAEESEVVVLGRGRRRVAEMLIQDGGDVRADRRMRRFRGCPQLGNVVRAEKERRVERQKQREHAENTTWSRGVGSM